MKSEEFNDTEYQREAVLANCYFMLAEAQDMMLKELQIMLRKRNAELTQRMKQRHTNILNQLTKLRTSYDSFMWDYHIGLKDYRKTDNLRHSAAYIARIMLLIADRCNKDEKEGAREQRIERYIHNMPDGGLIDDDFLSKFFIR